MLISRTDEISAKVTSLEEKYVKYLYKKLNAIEKCNPCRTKSGKFHI